MKLRHVVNTKRKFGEAGCYYYAKVTLPNGIKKDALFLESSVDDALIRAEKQREDVPRSSRWPQWLLKWMA